MSRIEEMLAELCPNGVPYGELNELGGFFGLRGGGVGDAAREAPRVQGGRPRQGASGGGRCVGAVGLGGAAVGGCIRGREEGGGFEQPPPGACGSGLPVRCGGRRQRQRALTGPNESPLLRRGIITS